MENSCTCCPISVMKNSLKEDNLIELQKNSHQIVFYPGDVIAKQGLFVSQLFHLNKGVVSIILEHKNNKQTILDYVTNPNILGLQILGNPETYPYTLKAVTECKICIIKKETFEKIVITNAKVYHDILKKANRDFLKLYEKINIINTRNNHGKLCSALFSIHESTIKTEILNSISRKELAQFASISLESCNKILVELKNDQLIDIKNNIISISRPDLIEKLSTAG